MNFYIIIYIHNMNKENREKKIHRDKRDKKIRHKLDCRNYSFDPTVTDWNFESPILL
jgi:hypothetical protein